MLHDIGKTVLIAFLPHQELTDQQYQKMLRDFHPDIGARVAAKWNLADIVRAAIRFHHIPLQTKEHRRHVMIIHHADNMAHCSTSREYLPKLLKALPADDMVMADICEEVDHFRSLTSTMI